MREAAVLRRSFKELAPDYAGGLQFADARGTGNEEMGEYLTRFFQRLRDGRKRTKAVIEYAGYVEFRQWQPHTHLALRTGLPLQAIHELMRQWWRNVCPGRDTSVYCDHVDTPDRWAKYITGDLLGHRIEPPPLGWDGRACKLVWTSRKFLVEPKPDLWTAQWNEWH